MLCTDSYLGCYSSTSSASADRKSHVVRCKWLASVAPKNNISLDPRRASAFGCMFSNTSLFVLALL